LTEYLITIYKMVVAGYLSGLICYGFRSLWPWSCGSF